MLRNFALAACGLAVLAVGCVAMQEDATTSGAGTKMTKAEMIAHGQYLVDTIAACGNCHTPKGPDGDVMEMYLAGSVIAEPGLFTAVALNITPDKRTGIGTWSVDEIVTAIREGDRPDGTVLRPPMPFEMYRDLSDEDAYAIALYLKTVAPVEAEAEVEPEYHIPLPDSWGPPVGSMPSVVRDKPAAYGAYLAGPVGHCIECHTPVDEHHRLQMDLVGAGGRGFPGPWGESISRDIRAGDPNHGIGAWSDDEIITAITTGVRPDGTRLKPPMGYGYYADMTDDDLLAVVAYLRTLTP